MFGAPVAYFFEYLLGIRQTKESAGYREMIINPVAISKFGRMSGSMETPSGKVAVAYEREAGGVRFKVTIPGGSSAILRVQGNDYPLSEGENEIFVAE